MGDVTVVTAVSDVFDGVVICGELLLLMLDFDLGEIFLELFFSTGDLTDCLGDSKT